MSMRIRPTALACLFGTSLFITAQAQALVVTRGGFSYYDTGSNALPTTKQEFGSFARDFAQRSGFILKDGERERVDEQDPVLGDADFHGVKTFIPGVTVGMIAVLGDTLTPGPVPNPARAMTDKFSNHVLATTSRAFDFSTSTNRGESQDNNDPSDDYFVSNGRIADASSEWRDTWEAKKSEQVSLDFALEGSISLNPVCPAGTTCGVILPPGTDFHRTNDSHFELRAVMAVFDLSTLVPCEVQSDECDGEDPAPQPLDSITVLGGKFADSRTADYAALQADGTLDVEIIDTLEFDAIEGNEYYVLSLLSVRSENGVRADFLNSFKLTGVNATPGALLSSALGDQDITAHFSAVPLPGALWLMLGGLGSLGLRGARRRASTA